MTDAVIARLGPGARYDDPAAPHDDLLAARRATADFARVLNALSDDALSPARRRIIARVGYEARALAYALEAIDHLAPDPFDLDAAIMRGETLPARALRALFQHSSIHLNVAWRDLSGNNWAASITLRRQRVRVDATPKQRARALNAASANLA